MVTISANIEFNVADLGIASPPVPRLVVFTGLLANGEISISTMPSGHSINSTTDTLVQVIGVGSTSGGFDAFNGELSPFDATADFTINSNGSIYQIANTTSSNPHYNGIVFAAIVLQPN